MLTRIVLRDLRVNCLIGCLAEERQRVQELGVEVELWLDTDEAARLDSLRHTWNYADIAAHITFVLEHGRFYLLEAAARVLLRWLLIPPAPDEARSPVARARVALTKFGVLPKVATPTVELAGDRVDFEREVKDWGTVDIVAETRHMGLYRLNISPGQAIPDHVHRRMREAELVLADGLVGWIEGGEERLLRAGERFVWKHGVAHGYRNRDGVTHSLLCLDRPPFEPSDEVEVPSRS